jgi:ubiquitin carboxyl-terminal hydrolase 5/13
VEVPAPDVLDLESLRATGPTPDEVLQPEDGKDGSGAAPAGGAAAPAAAEADKPDASIVAALVAMGFSENGSKRAGAF